MFSSKLSSSNGSSYRSSQKNKTIASNRSLGVCVSSNQHRYKQCCTAHLRPTQGIRFSSLKNVESLAGFDDGSVVADAELELDEVECSDVDGTSLDDDVAEVRILISEPVRLAVAHPE